MLRVTEPALDELAELRETSEMDEGEAFVLVPGEGGSLGMTVGSPGEGDQVVEREGIVLLVVSSELEPALDGVVLDFTEGAAGGEWQLARE